MHGRSTRPNEGKAYIYTCISYQLRSLADKGISSFQTLEINRNLLN